MKIAIASGKGGTGKTLIATNLASFCAEKMSGVWYADCDVEEPNGHIFLKPRIVEEKPVHQLIPEVDTARCTSCGLCSQICQYRAIVSIADEVLVFPELCHSCGGCMLVCPVDAITEKPKKIGEISRGSAKGVQFLQGRLDITVPMSPPLIKEVKRQIPADGTCFIDSPPGTSCPVIESVRSADFVVLVTEPTPFGLYDLKLAVEMVKKLDIPMGVVVNRADMGYNEIERYCAAERIEVLLRYPDDRRVAEVYSRGELIVDALPDSRGAFDRLYSRISSGVCR
jgi:MinD superfamily P-loop ATPase